MICDYMRFVLPRARVIPDVQVGVQQETKASTVRVPNLVVVSMSQQVADIAFCAPVPRNAEQCPTLSGNCMRTPVLQPGYLRPLLPDVPPKNPELWSDIKRDFWDKIIPGKQAGCTGQLGPNLN